MSDPLSVAAGVVGVITAAAQISSLLIKFTRSTITAPQQAKVVLTEVSDIGVILLQLQPFLLGQDLPDRSRTSLLKVEKVVTIVSGCVLTFSELEKLLDELKTENMDILNRLNWVRKESAITSLIQRLQSHKTSLSLVLGILNGFVLICRLYFACMLIFRRHTIAEAKDSVDRLHALVESCYTEMSTRIKALEALSMQQDDTHWLSKDDTESLATIHAHRPDVNSENIMASELGDFNFSDELQRSRVYRRNQAFCTSVISVLTNSVWSLGWSFFSDLSMAEVSNFSVINLAITKGEVFNSGRSLQTWSARPNGEVANDDYIDEDVTQLYKDASGTFLVSKSLVEAQGHRPASVQIQKRNPFRARSPLPRSQPLGRDNIHPQWKEHNKDKKRTRSAKHLDLPSGPSLEDPLNALPPSKAQAPFFTQFNQKVEDEVAYPCKGCGEVSLCHTTFQLIRPLPQIGVLMISTLT